MRNSLSLLALSATLAAQEPPVLITTPPVLTPQFNGAALGGGVTQVAQLTMIYNPSGTPAPQWYVTATVQTPASTFWTGWTGTATGTPGNYTLTANGDLANLPPPTTDYFAFNVSDDLKVLVFDSGGSTQPGVYVRSAPSGAFVPFGAVPPPVPAGYRDSQMGDTITSWNGTTGVYQFVYIDGNNLKKVEMTLTAPSTVTLGTPIPIATSAVAKHSPSPLRQQTGLPSEWGTSRAFIFSQNDSSADSYFRSTLADDTVVTAPLMRIYDDGNWKANPGHIGGALYWAYATATYGNPMLQETVAMSSATVPSAGGTLTICGWAPPSASPWVGFVMLGLLQSPGINLSPIVTRGLLGLNPGALVFLPAQVFDTNLGEMSYTFVTGFLPRGRIDMQIGALNLATNQIYLGNNAGIYVQ